MPIQLRVVLWLGFLVVFATSGSVFAADGIDYVRDVKPILKMHCFRCHGPLKSESGLRLDTKALALKGGESGPALTPGNSANSELVQRITDDEESRMPPEGNQLSDDEIATLKKWIAAGAVSPVDEKPEDPRAHWSYQPIQRPEPPAVGDAEWSRNPIDAFILRKQHQAKVVPRPPAPRHVLLRRVYLDLIGLPPSREQLRAFLADKSPDAYEKAVDNLLASSHYGERWGRHWLDVWRYSDWYGFQNQVRFSQKNIWHWRDWVVESLNADKGYERMAMEMLAGDEIEPFEYGNLRATGFLVRNRNTDSREQWIRDTVEHTAKAFLALTIACVQCHDHPYDPIWQDEYYRYRNIFEPVAVAIDSGGGGLGGIDLTGVARIYDRNQKAVTKFYIRGNDRTPDEKKTITPGVPQVFGEWTEPKQVQLPPLARIPHLRTPVADQAIARLQHNVRQAELTVASAQSFLADTKRRLATTSKDSSKPSEDTFLLDTFQEERSDVWKKGPGQWDYSKGYLTQSNVGGIEDCWLEAVREEPTDFTLRLRFRITGGTKNRSVGIVFNANSKGGRGEGVFLTANEEKQELSFFNEFNGNRNLVDNLRREISIKLNEEYVLRVDVRGRLVNVFVNDVLLQAYDVANRSPAGTIRLWMTDAAAEFHHLRVDPLPADAPMAPAKSISLFSPIAQLDKSHPSHLSFANAVFDQARLKFEIQAAELVSHKATWTADAWKFLNPPPEGDEAAAKSHETRHEELAKVAQAAQRRLALCKAQETRFLAEHGVKSTTTRAEHGKKDDEKLAKALDDAKKKLGSVTKQLEAAQKLVREPPTAKYRGLPGGYGSSSGRRLSLARWVAAPQNPLTARVAVNHIWLRHFGRALVETVFDFGLRGAKPSHPELLDWLASELRQPSLVLSVKDGQSRWIVGKPSAGLWSMKHLHRLIVTSRTYRSGSTPDTTNLANDPDNDWLWRMPPRRMDAETVRDSVLHAAGQLDPKIGGPDLPCADGMSVPRRSLYFHHSPEKQMAFLKLFDGADPTECYRRHVSIVPHQALALFNSELALVQSRFLARRMSAKFNETDAFIQATFEQVLTRPATEKELTICQTFLASREKVYGSNEQKNATVTTNPKNGHQPSADPKLHARENLVHSLFNHHEFVTIR